MFEKSKLVRLLKNEKVKTDNKDSSDEIYSESNDTTRPIMPITMPYPSDMPNGYKLLNTPNCFFKRRFLSGVSSCKNISFIRATGSSGLTEESLDDLMKMLKFKSEPCYQRPYRLIADSKLCIKGNCDTVSKILRPGW